MKKPNLTGGVEKPDQKLTWPVWIPYPSAWLKSVVLAIFLRVIVLVIKNASEVNYRLVELTNNLELFVILSILIILSPILVIAYTHHILHLCLNHFMADIQAPEIGKIKGILPGLMSWWEGLYGWLAIVISTLIAFFCITFFMPLFDINYTRIIISYSQPQESFINIFGIFYIIGAAIIYQIEYLVKQRIISVYSGAVETSKKQSK